MGVSVATVLDVHEPLRLQELVQELVQLRGRAGPAVGESDPEEVVCGGVLDSGFLVSPALAVLLRAGLLSEVRVSTGVVSGASTFLIGEGRWTQSDRVGVLASTRSDSSWLLSSGIGINFGFGVDSFGGAAGLLSLFVE